MIVIRITKAKDNDLTYVEHQEWLRCEVKCHVIQIFWNLVQLNDNLFR
jgi:hypothetical protein